MKNNGDMFGCDSLLSGEEEERLNIVIEECAEVLQAIAKIKRFGYNSTNPELLVSTTNREDLTREVGDLINGLNMLMNNNDIDRKEVNTRAIDKSKNIHKYLRYSHIMTE